VTACQGAETSTELLQEVESIESRIVQMEQDWATTLTQLYKLTVHNTAWPTDWVSEPDAETVAKHPLLDVITLLLNSAIPDLSFINSDQRAQYVTLLQTVQQLVQKIHST
jgi:hypothetical protein